jgi:hypothetical protein
MMPALIDRRRAEFRMPINFWVEDFRNTALQSNNFKASSVVVVATLNDHSHS